MNKTTWERVDEKCLPFAAWILTAFVNKPQANTDRTNEKHKYLCQPNNQAERQTETGFDMLDKLARKKQRSNPTYTTPDKSCNQATEKPTKQAINQPINKTNLLCGSMDR